MSLFLTKLCAIKPLENVNNPKLGIINDVTKSNIESLILVILSSVLPKYNFTLRVISPRANATKAIIIYTNIIV